MREQVTEVENVYEHRRTVLLFAVVGYGYFCLRAPVDRGSVVIGLIVLLQ
ncbi:MAG: hypothetical protein WEE89_03285 [Gemmatimonadota bacterium]